VRRLLAGLVGLVLSSPGAAAQAPSFTGTYVNSSPTDPTISLVLTQDAQGRVGGTWWASDTAFQVNARLDQDGAVLGTLSGPTGGVYFSARLNGAELDVTLIEFGANNQQLDYSRTRTLTLTRQGGWPALGAAPTPQPPPPAAPTPLSIPGDQPGARTALLPGWNIRYALPPGWQVGRSLGRVQVLASTTEAGAVFIAPGLYASFDEMVSDLLQFYQSMKLMATPVQPPVGATFAGLRALTATYRSQDQMGQVVDGRYVALLTPHGTGLALLGMTTPQQMPQLAATVERLAATVQAQAPQVNPQAIAALAGRWMYYAGRAEGVTRSMGGSSHSYDELVTFDGRSAFQWQSSASVSVTVPQDAGGAGRAEANSDQGTYTVVGSTLILKGSRGQMAFELQLLGDRFSADGRVYVRSK
jgi:hypothetical protein